LKNLLVIGEENILMIIMKKNLKDARNGEEEDVVNGKRNLIKIVIQIMTLFIGKFNAMVVMLFLLLEIDLNVKVVKILIFVQNVMKI